MYAILITLIVLAALRYFVSVAIRLAQHPNAGKRASGDAQNDDTPPRVSSIRPMHERDVAFALFLHKELTAWLVAGLGLIGVGGVLLLLAIVFGPIAEVHEW